MSTVNTLKPASTKPQLLKIVCFSVYHVVRKRFVYRIEYDRTKRFTRLLDECAVDTTGVRVEIINNFKRVADELLRLSATHGKSKKLMNINFVLYQLCKKNGIDVDKSKFKLPKSKKSHEKHENICQEIFRRLGWNYISIL